MSFPVTAGRIIHTATCFQKLDKARSARFAFRLPNPLKSSSGLVTIIPAYFVEYIACGICFKQM